jgi:hypothetical protein
MAMLRGLSEHCFLRVLEIYTRQVGALERKWLELFGCKIEIDLMKLLAEF